MCNPIRTIPVRVKGILHFRFALTLASHTAPIKVIVPILITGAGLLSMAFIALALQDKRLPLWVVSQHEEINFTFTHQVTMLLISSTAAGLMFLYDRNSFKQFFRARSNQQSDWKFLGPVVAAGFTLGTAMFMSFSVIAQNGTMNETFFKLLPLVLVFAATNAWSEEIISRFVIVAGLHDKLKPDIICWISAALFGLAHIYGTPNGIFGVMTSGFLGWMLAKSVIETRGIGWAWFIHFLQDVVIFGAGAMTFAGHD